MAFSKVLLSHRPTVDRIGAFDIVQKALGLELEIEFVNQTISLSDADVRTLINDGVIPIGVGKGRTYRERNIDGKKFGSETAIMVHTLRFSKQLPLQDEVLDGLMARLGNDNNNGVLTNQPYSVGWIIRQAWRLDNDHEEWVRRAAHVVRMYLEACKNGNLDLAMRKRFTSISAMRLLPKEKRSHQGPMTVVRYMRDMFVLGVDEDEILRRAEPFVRMHDRANEKKREAEKIAETGNFETFHIPGHDAPGTWVDSDDPYLLSALAYRRHLVAMRNIAGNVIVMSQTFNLEKVGIALQKQEPKLWHIEYMPRNIVANGTEGISVPATGLSRMAIEYVIGANVIRKER